MAAAASSSFAKALIFGENNVEANNYPINEHQQHSDVEELNSSAHTYHQKRKRKLPGTPGPDAEVIALSRDTLTSNKRYTRLVYKKGFKRGSKPKDRVYTCPETECVHHEPHRALSDLTGIKKHYYRKHIKKTFKCLKCSKTYAVDSDLKTHAKTCGTQMSTRGNRLFKKKDCMAPILLCDADAYNEESSLNLGLSHQQHESGFCHANSFTPNFGSNNDNSCIFNGSIDLINNNIPNSQFGQNNIEGNIYHGGMNLVQSNGYNQDSNIYEGTMNNQELSLFSATTHMQTSPTFTSFYQTPPIYPHYNNFPQPNTPTTTLLPNVAQMPSSSRENPTLLQDSILGDTIPFFSTLPLDYNGTFGEPTHGNTAQRFANSSRGDQSFSSTSSIFGFGDYEGFSDMITRDFLGGVGEKH